LNSPDSNHRIRNRVLKDVAWGPIMETGASVPGYSGGVAACVAACAAVSYPRPEGCGARAKVLSSFFFFLLSFPDFSFLISAFLHPLAITFGGARVAGVGRG
jgi:hypothetical protein